MTHPSPASTAPDTSKSSPAADAAPGKPRRRWPRRMLACGAALAAVAVALLFAASALFPFPIGRLHALRQAASASVVLDRHGQPLRAFLGHDGSLLYWTPLDRVSLRLVQATLAAEDSRFYTHPGVDPLSLARACVQNATHGRVISGASTVTMQLIRIMDRRPRGFVSKAVEAFRALQLERILTKNQILELYLNLAPYGGNLLGVQAAAQRYFGKSALDVTLDEAALIAGLPQSPSRLRPDRHAARAHARRDSILGRMERLSLISPAELARALARPVRPLAAPLPFDAPHFALYVRSLYPRAQALRSTLDPQVQQISLAALRDGVEKLRAQGVSNGAVVVIENATASLRALAGSCDFADADALGQVNAALAPRSPGSTLKPFIYALAYDDGLITPSAILADAPQSHAGYEPENYDRQYRGPVPAAQALALSLNAPAVALLRQTGLHRVHRLLVQLGLTTLARTPDRWGLALALGAAPVNLLELTNAYATLARMGRYVPLRTLEEDPTPPSSPVLSPGAACLTVESLATPSRLSALALCRAAESSTRMAWKTGTSFGNRDAWTVAFTPAWTVGVWIGNPSGQPSAALVGQKAAAPIAARIIEQLHARQPCPWFTPPPGVAPRPVCAVSGQPAGPHCPSAVEELCLQGKPSGPCAVHVLARIDTQTGALLCPCCSPGRQSDQRMVEQWPPELAAWLLQAGRGASLAPPHYPACARATATGAPPRILSPSPDQTCVVVPGASHPQRLTLKAASSASLLHWFVDGAWLAATRPLEPAFWTPAPGPHTILCADPQGRNASVSVTVK